MIYAAGDDAGGGNPFAVLTAVVAPAILTNACSVGVDVGPSLEDRDKEGPTPHNPRAQVVQS